MTYKDAIAPSAIYDKNQKILLLAIGSFSKISCSRLFWLKDLFYVGLEHRFLNSREKPVTKFTNPVFPRKIC
jgi:hypothetical protein